MPITTEYTAFTRDVLGRYFCNTFDEAIVTIDANARAAAGLPQRGDLRQFDFIIIGGGAFGAALAEHLWFRSTNRSERILVLEGGLSLPKMSSRLEILVVREVISHSAPSSSASLFRWFASYLWSSSLLSFCSFGA